LYFRRPNVQNRIQSLPLFYTHTINATTKLAIWHIAEPDDFFLDKVPVSRLITHPHKRLQHLAGRYLLQYLFPGFPLSLIQIADTRKPYLQDESHHFSISHCSDYAAAIVSTTDRVGIDIEVPAERIRKIQHKYLTEQEAALLTQHSGDAALEPSMQQLTLAWSAKESMFKWYGLGEVDFRQHMHIKTIDRTEAIGVVGASFTKEDTVNVMLQYRFFDGLALSWLATAP